MPGVGTSRGDEAGSQDVLPSRSLVPWGSNVMSAGSVTAQDAALMGLQLQPGSCGSVPCITQLKEASWAALFERRGERCDGREERGAGGGVAAGF